MPGQERTDFSPRGRALDQGTEPLAFPAESLLSSSRLTSRLADGPWIRAPNRWLSAQTISAHSGGLPLGSELLRTVCPARGRSTGC